MAETKLLLAILNSLFGLGIAALAFRKLAQGDGCMKLWCAAHYALLLTAGLVIATQPWAGRWPTPGGVFCSGVIFVYAFATSWWSESPLNDNRN